MRFRIAFGIVILVLATPYAKAESLFQIGNSLTNDSFPYGIEAIAQQAGIDFVGGHHVKSNSTLNQIWNSPESTNTLDPEFGTFTGALTNNVWDHVTLQASDNGSSSLGEDQDYVTRFVDLAQENSGNADTKFYVYGAWPNIFRWGSWENPVSDDPTEPSWHRRQYFQQLTDNLNDASDNDFRLIPAGEVFFELIDRLDGVAFDGLDHRSDFYRDSLHANSIGSFAAATTVFATVFRTNPIGVPVPREISGWSESTISDQLALEIQQVVWDVLVDEKRSGVSPYGDYNIDTVIDQADRLEWVDDYGAQTAVTADANGDGVVDDADATIWLDAIDPGGADINGNEAVDSGDYEAWDAAYGDTGLTPADANGDGLVNAADYTAWRDALELARSADFNNDGVTDSQDLDLWYEQRGWAIDLPTDVNGDGIVNAADYTVWRDNYEAIAAGTELVAPLPEPSALALMLTLCVGSIARRG